MFMASPKNTQKILFNGENGKKNPSAYHVIYILLENI